MDRLQRLVAALLDVSRLQHEQLELQRQPLNFTALLRQIIEDVALTLQHHTLAASYADEEVWVAGDDLRLEQVIYNLLQNAIKYSPQGGTITVALQPEGDGARLMVADSGIGIPAADLPRLFERFFRASNVQAQRISGMGMGLHLVSEIVEQHGGRVTVELTEGVGSTFRVWLPRLRPAPSSPR